MSVSIEQSAYEIGEIWEETWFGEPDRVRMDTFTAKVPSSARSVLDVGCGNGLFLRHLAETFPNRFERLCGAERSEKALAHVTTEKRQASADSLPFADSEFDTVVSLEVIEHLPLAIYERALDEMARVAREHILIGVPYDQDLRTGLTECPKCKCRFNHDWHVRSYDNEASLRTLFDTRGFQCTDLFFVWPMKRFPRAASLGLEQVKAFVRGTSTAFPNYAVCPMCGYEETYRLREPAPATPPPPPGRAATFARKLLARTQTYRWAGALYVRR